LLMVKRGEAMVFAAGALVFPGGRIDEDDRAIANGDTEQAARVAGIRETIEETAIPAALTPPPSDYISREIQAALLAGERFSGLLQQHGLTLDLGALTPFARWVPQFHAVRRFDTWFFVARADEARSPHPSGGECADAFWISAEEALAREREGEARLIFPTRRNLERLALHDNFEAIRADALAHKVQPITPWLETGDGDEFVTIPEGIGYPVTREKLDGLWRG
jgi:8-oxo-dGTP pyrophosphatase MutT (NUDIX family)